MPVTRVRRLARIAVAAVIASSPGRADPPPPAYSDHSRLLVVRDDRGNERPVASPADWATRRAHIVAAMQEVMGPLPGGDRKVPLDPQVSEEIAGERHVRKK